LSSAFAFAQAEYQTLKSRTVCPTIQQNKRNARLRLLFRYLRAHKVRPAPNCGAGRASAGPQMAVHRSPRRPRKGHGCLWEHSGVTRKRGCVRALQTKPEPAGCDNLPEGLRHRSEPTLRGTSCLHTCRVQTSSARGIKTARMIATRRSAGTSPIK
jgi:hypothetical protein